MLLLSVLSLAYFSLKEEIDPAAKMPLSYYTENHFKDCDNSLLLGRLHRLYLLPLVILIILGLRQIEKFRNVPLLLHTKTIPYPLEGGCRAAPSSHSQSTCLSEIVFNLRHGEGFLWLPYHFHSPLSLMIEVSVIGIVPRLVITNPVR